MVKGPGYTFEDLWFYSGLIGGVACTYPLLSSFNLHHIVQLLIAGAVGLVIGWAATYVYRAYVSSGNDRSAD